MCKEVNIIKKILKCLKQQIFKTIFIYAYKYSLLLILLFRWSRMINRTSLNRFYNFFYKRKIIKKHVWWQALKSVIIGAAAVAAASRVVGAAPCCRCCRLSILVVRSRARGRGRTGQRGSSSASPDYGYSPGWALLAGIPPAAGGGGQHGWWCLAGGEQVVRQEERHAGVGQVVTVDRPPVEVCRHPGSQKLPPNFCQAKIKKYLSLKLGWEYT